jgi:hypothetical protein
VEIVAGIAVRVQKQMALVAHYARMFQLPPCVVYLVYSSAPSKKEIRSIRERTL